MIWAGCIGVLLFAVVACGKIEPDTPSSTVVLPTEQSEFALSESKRYATVNVTPTVASTPLTSSTSILDSSRTVVFSKPTLIFFDFMFDVRWMRSPQRLCIASGHEAIAMNPFTEDIDVIASGDKVPSVESRIIPDCEWALLLNMQAYLPSNAENVGLSPSGEKMIYFVDIESNPTPSSSIDGELYLGGNPVGVWLWEDGASREVAQIADCDPRYLWTASEDKVLLDPDVMSGCSYEQFLLLDLNDNSQTNLLPSQDFPGAEVEPEAFLLNGEQLLYGLHVDSPLLSKLEVIQLETPKSREVDLPFSPIQKSISEWLTLDLLLVVYFEDSSGSRQQKLGVFDVNNGDVIPILNDPLPTIVPSTHRIVDLQVSPDRRWIAFVTKELDSWSYGDEQKVWIVEVSIDETE